MLHLNLPHFLLPGVLRGGGNRSARTRRSLRCFVHQKATFGGVGKIFFSLSVNRSRLCNWVVMILRGPE